MSLFKPFIQTLILLNLFNVSLSSAAAENNDNRSAHKEKLPLAELQRFTAALDIIKNYYVNPISDSKLLEDAIHGMLAGLDPHSNYLNVQDFSDLKMSTSGKFQGLGIEVMAEDGLIRIISPIDGTPAETAGIKAGDLIVRIDDSQVKGLTLTQAVDKMRGEKGSSIVLTIIRSGAAGPLKIKVVRDTINVKSIKARYLMDDLAYIRVTQFQMNSGDDLIKAINKLRTEPKRKIAGLILDLRNNPGGILDASVQIADTFLDRTNLKYQGTIVFTKGRMPNSKLVEKASKTDLLAGAPIVVLVNGGSASASEIVAGALQDHQRAIIVGNQTFGKGSVQTIMPLKDKRGLKLTTALYYTPSGRSIQAVGITPDILVNNLKIPYDPEDKSKALSFREQDFNNHLKNQDSHQPSQLKVKDDIPLINADYQLYEALNVLKSLVIAKKT